MKLVDTIKCVYCGETEYRLAKGKAGRVFNAVCSVCETGMESLDETTKDEPKGKPKVVPSGKQGS